MARGRTTGAGPTNPTQRVWWKSGIFTHFLAFVLGFLSSYVADMVLEQQSCIICTPGKPEISLPEEGKKKVMWRVTIEKKGHRARTKRFIICSRKEIVDILEESPGQFHTWLGDKWKDKSEIELVVELVEPGKHSANFVTYYPENDGVTESCFYIK